MEDKEPKPVLLSRPKDESLEAFKAWVMEFLRFFRGDDAVDDSSPEEWEKRWRAFWKKKDGSDSDLQQSKQE